MPEPTDFSSLGLQGSLLEALAALGFDTMTEVQARTLPSVLAGRDVIAQAEPGSGKTVAFGLGLLSALFPHLAQPVSSVRALAVCPTRELAEQIATELRRLARRTPNIKVLALCGGVPFRPQRDSLAQGAHVVVGTPGRLEEHLRKGSLRLDQLSVLVLDEADRMLDMGFAPQLDAVVQYAPRERQTLLFSATFPDSIAKLAQRYQRDPEHIVVEPPGVAAAGAPSAAGARGSVEQLFFRVSERERPAALVRWLRVAQPASTLVFSNTRAECASVALELRARGFSAASIHGELASRERTHVMRLFANESCSVLVATDVAARGWDIAGLSAVVNLGLPRDPSVHLHRIGRTGRSGQPGLAVHFVCDEDRHALAAIERYQGRAASFSELPSSAGAPPPPQPRRVTLLLAAGRNKKLRPGDILGALTAEGGVSGAQVGSIHIDDSSAYVAVDAAVADQALARLESAPIKGRRVKVVRAGLSLASDEQGSSPEG
jgi:ATP-dependent RNA helicase DbpA